MVIFWESCYKQTKALNFNFYSDSWAKVIAIYRKVTTYVLYVRRAQSSYSSYVCH